MFRASMDLLPEPVSVWWAIRDAHGLVVGAGDDASSGIGLAVCRRIVEAHGGAIVAEPAPDGGTAMRFSLPD